MQTGKMKGTPRLALLTSLFIVQLVIFGLVQLLPVAEAQSDSAAWPIDVGSTQIRLPPLKPAKPYREYVFNVTLVNKTENCRAKLIPVVNGTFPGPTIYANEGDRIKVTVNNYIDENVTIHFHGIHQTHSVWMDGVAYVTMCPLKPGASFVHDFTFENQSGTFLWHAHVNSMRATLHGAIVVYPKDPYPFPRPEREFEVVLGEWWYKNITDLELQAKDAGKPLTASDGYVINGLVGTNAKCNDSSTDVGNVLDVVDLNRYLIRVINAAVDTELFFSIGGQIMAVVEADGNDVKQFETTYIFIAPGQTINVLVAPTRNGSRQDASFYMSVLGYEDQSQGPFLPVAAFHVLPPQTTPGVLAWQWSPSISKNIFLDALKNKNDSRGSVFSFTGALKSLYSGLVPQASTRNITVTVGIRYRSCLDGESCTLRSQGSLNNFTFDLPQISLLEADYYGYHQQPEEPSFRDVFNESFPDHPPVLFDFTSGKAQPPAAERIGNGGTEVLPVTLGSVVDIVLQDTSPFENHPFHLHGHDFFVVGHGGGNYDYSIDPLNYNLDDPPLRNTIGIPYRGWVALRWVANNPGMWLFHCHLDKHTLEGMQTVFLVDADYGSPPAEGLPPC